MKRKVKIFSIIMLIIITLSSFMATISYADLINPNDYNPNNRNEEVPEKFTNMVGIIATTIQTIGVILSIIVIGLLGIKYMTGSVEEKADYKKSLIFGIHPVIAASRIADFVGTHLPVVAYVVKRLYINERFES